jgi:hypothetical protein
MKIKELHLIAGYPSVFKDIPDVKIESLPLQGECTDVFLVTIDDKIAEEYKVTEMTKEYLDKGIGSFMFGYEDWMKYLNREGFINFLRELPNDKITTLYTESVEDGSIDKYNFMKMGFNGNTIILYDHPSGHVGIIQDSPIAPWDDYAEGVYEDLTMNDEYKLFIEA